MLANTSIKNNLLIIISHSARALSESASRAGWDVISVDGFADTDTLESCYECWCLPLVVGEFLDSHIKTCLLKLQQRHLQAKVILGAGAESLTDYIETIPGWELCGNNSTVVSQLKDARLFFESLSELQISYPPVRFDSKPKDGDWLYKLENSCGGMGVSCEVTNDDQGYWQQEILGMAISALCISDGQEVVCLGFNQQYSTSSFHGYPYVYQGALANVDLDNLLKDKTIGYINNIINRFNFKGVFSLDMILAQHQANQALYVLEINPRISASFELYERINPSLNLVDAHIRVCEGERLREIELNGAQSAYLIVYAQDNCLISQQLVWPEWVKDRPEALRQISKHEPICSVYADAGESNDSLFSLLQSRANQIISLVNQ